MAPLRLTGFTWSATNHACRVADPTSDCCGSTRTVHVPVWSSVKGSRNALAPHVPTGLPSVVLSGRTSESCTAGQSGPNDEFDKAADTRCPVVPANVYKAF